MTDTDRQATTAPDFARWYMESALWTGADYLWLNRFRDLYAATRLVPVGGGTQPEGGEADLNEDGPFLAYEEELARLRVRVQEQAAFIDVLECERDEARVRVQEAELAAAAEAQLANEYHTRLREAEGSIYNLSAEVERDSHRAAFAEARLLEAEQALQKAQSGEKNGTS